MALSYVDYPQYGSQELYSIPFPYLDRKHVTVRFDGVETSDFVFETDKTIRLTTIPPGGTVVSIRRKTGGVERIINFQDGATLTEADLDTDSDQMFFLCQEAADRADESISLKGGAYDAGERRVASVGDPVGDQDAVNLRTMGARYPDIQTVAPYATAIESVARDLTSLSLYEMDLGSITAPPSYNANGTTSNIKVVAEGMSYVISVGSIQADVQKVSLRISDVQTCATNIEAIIGASALVDAAINASTGAMASKNAAATSATNAATSEANALTYKNASATSEANAFAYKNAAADSAAAAAASVGSVRDGAVTSEKLASTLDLGVIP